MGKTKRVGITEEEFGKNCLRCPVPDECNWRDPRCLNKDYIHPTNGNAIGVKKEPTAPVERNITDDTGYPVLHYNLGIDFRDE